MSTTAKRNFMNGNARSSFNMKDNWSDYGSSNGQNLSPNRQNKNAKFQQNKNQNGGRMMTKGGNFTDAETASGILSQFNSKCAESMATVPNVSNTLIKSNEETDCILPSDDSSLMLNQDPAIAAIAPTTELQKDENKQAAEMANQCASIVPQIQCDTNHYQQYQAVYGTDNSHQIMYDGYSTPNQNHQMIQQQQYVWQSTSAQQPFPVNDYASVAAANAAAAVINNTAQQAQNGLNTPVNISSPPTAYYTPGPSYQQYVYDPAITAVSYPNMVTTTATYSPMSNAQAILSSPQQQNSTAMFHHTYQTPPQLTKYPQQFYMTPPASGSPSDLLNSNPHSGDRNLAPTCETPQTLGHQQQPAGIYTTASPYVYTSSYLTSPPQPNTAYQYQTPIMYSPPQAQPSTMPGTQMAGGPAQLVHHQSALLQTPTTAFQNLTINTNNTNTNDKYNNGNTNKFMNNSNNIKSNHYNYKKNPMNKSRQLGGYSPMSEATNNLFSPMNGQSQTGLNQQLCFDESLNTDDQTASATCTHGDFNNSPQMYRQGSLIFPPTSYMSPMPTSSTLPFQQTPTPNMPPTYDFSNGTGYNNLTPPMPATVYGSGFDYNQYDSYGDEFVDDNEPRESSNGDDTDDNGEQLACQICRGRRMCFCYFLKVRYYKFPSFFDLVDHQYKKWRSTMATQTPRKA